MASFATKCLQWLEVKHDGEVYSDRPVTRWGNRDIFPVPEQQRRFTATSYWSFWVIASMSVTAWGFGGSVLALGLSAGDGIACAVIASICVGLFAYLCGNAGIEHHLGLVHTNTLVLMTDTKLISFTAMARTTFGLWGSYLPVLLLVFENVIFVRIPNLRPDFR